MSDNVKSLISKGQLEYNKRNGTDRLKVKHNMSEQGSNNIRKALVGKPGHATGHHLSTESREKLWFP